MMKTTLFLIFKLAAACFFLAFLFSPRVNAQTCEVRIVGHTVIIDLKELADTAGADPVFYKITVYTDTCKSFNPGQNYQKAFCDQVEPQQPGTYSTTAEIEAGVFHSGRYAAYVHPYSKGAICSLQTNLPPDVPLTTCEFDISRADGAQKCGSGTCGAILDTMACPAGSGGPLTVDECCSINSALPSCSQGYKPVLSLDTSTYTPICSCTCDEDFTAQYEPCRSIKKQYEDIDEECEKIADPADPKKTECLLKLADCQKEYDACLACVSIDPTDPDKEPGVWTAFGCIAVQPGEFIATLIRIGFGIGGGIALLFMIVGAFKFLTSEGNPEAINNGRQMIINAIAGLVLIVFSVIVLKIIGVDVLELPGFAKP